MSEIRDKVIGEMLTAVDAVYFERYGSERIHTKDHSKVMNRILSVPELAIVDRGAKLPSVMSCPTMVHYKEALKKEGWVKEVK